MALEIHFLGVAQDGGWPQMGCKEPCCRYARENKLQTNPCCAIVINSKREWLVIDAPANLNTLLDAFCHKHKLQFESCKGILLSHGHLGHYPGILHFGKEAFNAQGLNLFLSESMLKFLKSQAHFGKLIDQHFQAIKFSRSMALFDELTVYPIPVPHRQDFSDCHGFILQGSSQSLLYISDIDTWHTQSFDVLEQLKLVDFAFLDGCFYSPDELGHRQQKEIPHPTVKDSLKLFDHLEKAEKSKIYFFHLNHSNPLLRTDSPEYKSTLAAGFKILSQGDRFQIV